MIEVNKMTSNTDKRVQTFKNGISEIAMEEIIFYTLCGFVPVNDGGLLGKSEDSFPMVKLDVDTGYHSIVVPNLKKASIRFQKEADQEIINNLFSHTKHKIITAMAMSTTGNAPIIKDKQIQDETMQFCANLEKRFSSASKGHYIYGMSESGFNGYQNTMETTNAFTLNGILPDDTHYNTNELYSVSSLYTKLTLAYMRERNIGLAEMISFNRPYVSCRTKNDAGKVVEQKFDFAQMVDNNLWYLQDEFIRDGKSMQASVIKYYRNLLKENKFEDTQKSEKLNSETTADDIMADVAERKSHTSTLAK